MNANWSCPWRAIAVLLLALLLPPLPASGAGVAAGGTWQPAGRPVADRTGGFTANVLPDGTVLVAGGADDARNWPNPLAASDRYDPATNTWRATGPLPTARFGHTATTLPDGTVIAIGGWDGADDAPLAAAVEAYDPATGTWHAAGSLAAGRWLHTATLLSDGTVLLVGGIGGQLDAAGPAPVERYDPPSGLARPTAPLLEHRTGHTATLLPDGTVLVTGGWAPGSSGPHLATAERYDPRTGTWRPAARMGTARAGHGAALLADGTVLIAGGTAISGGEGLASAEVYDPVADRWLAGGSLPVRQDFLRLDALADGTALALGVDSQIVQRYDPVAGAWSVEPERSPLSEVDATALLRDGSLLAIARDAAARFIPGTPAAPPAALPPLAGTWQPAGDLADPRWRHSVTALRDGTILVVGGQQGEYRRDTPDPAVLRSAELYDPATGAWRRTGDLLTPRAGHIAVPLPDGGALVFGGDGPGNAPLVSAERYIPAAGNWRIAAAPPETFLHTAAPLPDGTILAKGLNREAYRYDPATDRWRPGGTLPAWGLAFGQLVTLPDGAVLLVSDDHAARYDPAGSTWRELRADGLPRWGLASALADGTVLLTGGDGTHVYDPARETWRQVADMATARGEVILAAPYTLTPLPGGLLLAAGGQDQERGPASSPPVPLAVAEAYDLSLAAWRQAAPLAAARWGHVAAPLPDGSVLVVGGRGTGGAMLASAERFAPRAAPVPSASPGASPFPGLPNGGGGGGETGSGRGAAVWLTLAILALLGPGRWAIARQHPRPTRRPMLRVFSARGGDERESCAPPQG